ncbi:fungal-specific transcription factor domain-containing protein [Aspergillus parasiticus]|uniref:Fungal-specific transcription factor domain-containing protein n=1 Tax=Aspergillus parasiticus TaxID=5067 RepID=A0A5N6DF52_ASPPA|nr:fungal-specific transcription factor domain-containing protein [Aspergillus parasiticus]
MEHTTDRPRAQLENLKRPFISKKVIACHRCHAKKIKCSGTQPCQSCSQAEKGTKCSYPQRTRTVKVPQSFIDGLYEEISLLKKRKPSQDGHSPDPTPDAPQSPESRLSRLEEREQEATPPVPNEADLQIDPGTCAEPDPRANVQSDMNDSPWFDNSNIFRTPILNSETADTVFATRFRQILSDPHAPKPSHLLRLDYANDKVLMALVQSTVSWPSHSRARFLVEAALKYISRCHYIVPHDVSREGLAQVLLSPAAASPALCCKFWALFALGELYVTRAAATQGYPGMSYFCQASKMLCYLDERPDMETIETLLLLSIYSLALNRRYSAYVLSGTAMRSAITMGLHFNIPEPQLSDMSIQGHRQRLFWTAYMFDRMWAAQLGHPVAIQDEEIEVDMPDSQIAGSLFDDDSDCEYHSASIQLARLLTGVVQSIYSFRTQRQGKQLSSRVQQALQDLLAWVDQLPARLQVDHTSGAVNDLKTVSLYLSFYQCVILATRPVLLHILRIQVTGSSSATSELPTSASALSEACIRCARHSAQLLTQSWIDGLFVTFDCFFTHYLFSSLTILAISSILEGQDNQSDRDSFEEASRLLAELKGAGNVVAQEYCHHVEVIGAALTAHAKRTMLSESLDVLTNGAPSTSQLAPMLSRGSYLWTDSSLEQLLSQPALDMQFLEDAVRDSWSPVCYGPDFGNVG